MSENPAIYSRRSAWTITAGPSALHAELATSLRRIEQSASAIRLYTALQSAIPDSDTHDRETACYCAADNLAAAAESAKSTLDMLFRGERFKSVVTTNRDDSLRVIEALAAAIRFHASEPDDCHGSRALVCQVLGEVMNDLASEVPYAAAEYFEECANA